MYIRVNGRDNVAIIVSPDGVAPGAALADGLTAREAIPQSHKIALARPRARRPGAALRPDHRLRQPHDRRADAGCARSCSTCRPPPPLDHLPLAHRRPRPAAAARRLHVRGLSQPRWQRRHAQHPGNRHHRAMRRAHRRLRRAPHPRRDPAALPQRGRRGRRHALLRLRRGHRRARRGHSHPHPAAHLAARQPVRRTRWW